MAGTPLQAGAILPGVGVSNGSGGFTGTPAGAPTYNAGAKMPTQGAAGGVVTAGQGGTFVPQTATMNANISSPNATQTMNPPAVVTSTTAQNDLTNKQNQVSQLNADTQNQAATVAANTAAANAPQATPAQGTQTNTTNSTGEAGSLDSQVNDLLTSFNTNAGEINQNATTEANELGNEATEAQNQLDTAASTSLTQLNQISSGTYPLSPAESSILSATAAQFQSALQYQQQANASYTGQMTEAMASLGIETSAPTQAMGMINAAIGVGTQKIGDLNSQMAISLGNLQLAFQKEDFSEVQSAWDETSKYMEDRVTTLSSMQKNVQDAAAQQVSELQSATQTNISALINTSTLDEKAKQDTIQNAFTQQQITETQRHDLASELTAQMDAAKGQYSYNADTGQVFNTATGAFVADGSGAILNGTATPGNTGVPIVDNNTKTSSTGIPYVDGTNLTGTQAAEAQLEAAKLGIPYLGANAASAIGKIETAKQNLQNIANTLQGITPANFVEAAGDSLTYPIEGVEQSGTYGPTISAYNTFRSAAIQALTAVAGGTGSGLRINQAEILMSVKNDIPNPTDTAATANKKLQTMNSLLDSSEQGIFGTDAYNAFSSSAQTNPAALNFASNPETNIPTTSTNPFGI